MGATVAVLAAAGAARAQAELFERFRVADATAADRAQTLNKLSLEGSRYLDRFQAVGVIRQSPNSSGRYYLDEVALAAYQHRKRPRAVILALLVAGLAALAGALVLATQASHR